MRTAGGPSRRRSATGTAPPRDAERRVYTPTRSVGASWAGSRRQDAGSRRQEAGSRKQEAGGRRQEAGGRRQEAGSRSRTRSHAPRGSVAGTLRVPAAGRCAPPAVRHGADPRPVPPRPATQSVGSTLPRGAWERVGRKQEAGGRRQEAGSRRQEAEGRKQEAGSRKQEAGSRRQEPPAPIPPKQVRQ
ncbi:hypothetical protein BDD21_5253 [Thiocapsa rosea]|uniref:Uncharacterized protein n=1 Tax=Thiocapsa rosea TaxID=69360 RepID=A0A495VE86_9GAMM|nr:hypothetical protein BDD21_5253 [Thiocapsa rosea]